jgi:putative molybdopterin biosynthesis protein
MLGPHNDPAPEVALVEWLALLERGGPLPPAPVEDLAVEDALGRVLAEDVAARHACPPHRCAAMDGVAVQAASTAFAPVVLGPGEYVGIDTGELLDERWDAVVPAEETTADAEGMLVRHPTVPGRHVRPAGEDVAEGEQIVAAGTRLGPYHLGLAAACGHATLLVRAPVRVALLPTGDELLAPGAALAPGQIADSNSVMLAARLRDEGAAPRVLPIVPDDATALEAAVLAAAAEDPVVLVLAGSSRGTRDHTADVIGACGELAVQSVALRPAHPVLLGAVGAAAVVGVPGYPVSAALTFDRFVLPLLDRLMQRVRTAATVRVRVASELLPRRDAEVVVPLVLEPAADGIPLGVPQSRRGGALAGLARAGALLRLPAGANAVAAGTVMEADRI